MVEVSGCLVIDTVGGICLGSRAFSSLWFILYVMTKVTAAMANPAIASVELLVPELSDSKFFFFFSFAILLIAASRFPAYPFWVLFPFTCYRDLWSLRYICHSTCKIP